MWRPKMMQIPTAEEALPGRTDAMSVVPEHFVNGRDIRGECPPDLQEILIGMGCFWGAERLFWQLPGVEVTSVGYGGGHTPNPTYDEVCSGHTGHTELVRIWFDPTVISLDAILKVFWENHDPTQGMRQGNDVGTQYRSAIYTSDDVMLETAMVSRDRYQQSLSAAHYPDITTELRSGVIYYLAETHHQQYLAKNPNGYCGLAGCQVSFPSN